MCGHDADRGGAGGEAARSAVSASDFGDESWRHGAVDRVDFFGTSQALPGTGRVGILATIEDGCDSGFEDAVQADVGAGAEDDYQVDTGDHVAAAGAKAAGESRAQSG